MSKRKEMLEEAKKQLDSKVKETNRLIDELGNFAYSLDNVLKIIQEQFDKIRNVPSELKTQYNKIKKEHLLWLKQVDEIVSAYNAKIKINVSSGGAGTTLGVGIATLGPTAAMSIATTFGVASTGTAISTLSGAAATNAALAWLGGGTLATGGGGMVGGSQLLGLAGPVGWTIAGIAFLASGVLFFISRKKRNRLLDLFIEISERDIKKYDLAIVELNERISRIQKETNLLNKAIINIGTFGTDYDTMTEEQQYTLGSYVNLMNASTQLLINPILGLQPNVSEADVDDFFISHSGGKKDKKASIVYLANMLYGIETDESDRKMLRKCFKKSKDFRKQMNLEKSDIDLSLFNDVNDVINFTKQKKEKQ